MRIIPLVIGLFLSLNLFAASLTPTNTCEFFVDKVVENPKGGQWKSGQSVDLIVKVRPDLVDKVQNIQMKGKLANWYQSPPPSQPSNVDDTDLQFSPVVGLPGYFELALDTIQNPHDVHAYPAQYQVLLYLNLTNGQIFVLSPNNGGPFFLDWNFGNLLSARDTGFWQQPLPLSLIQSLPKTADIANHDGSARYINPALCR